MRNNTGNIDRNKATPKDVFKEDTKRKHDYMNQDMREREQPTGAFQQYNRV